MDFHAIRGRLGVVKNSTAILHPKIVIANLCDLIKAIVDELEEDESSSSKCCCKPTDQLDVEAIIKQHSRDPANPTYGDGQTRNDQDATGD